MVCGAESGADRDGLTEGSGLRMWLRRAGRAIHSISRLSLHPVRPFPLYTLEIQTDAATRGVDVAPELVRQIRAAGMRAAVAISPGTPSESISDELGELVDMLLVMTVVPGESLPLSCYLVLIGMDREGRTEVYGELCGQSRRIEEEVSSERHSSRRRSRSRNHWLLCPSRFVPPLSS
jgi:hypothetical protein